MRNKNDETPKNQNAGNQGDNNNRETDSEQKGEMPEDIKSELGKLNKTVNSMDDKLGKMQEKLNANKVWKCTCCCASRIIIVGLIAACLGFSIFVFVSMKNCEITVNETTTHIVKCNKNDTQSIINGKKETDETTTDNVKPPRPPYHGKVVQKKTNMYPIFCMAYFVVLAGTIAALIVLFIKDDSCFRCTKLNELRAIRGMLLDETFKGSVDKTEKEVEVVNSNTETKTTTTTETTDNRAELFKHYMNCIADI